MLTIIGSATFDSASYNGLRDFAVRSSNRALLERIAYASG